jgi:tetratricopeptide (TPR) repeat protein
MSLPATLRSSLATLALRRARRLLDRQPRAAARRLRWACRLAPRFGEAHWTLLHLAAKDDPLGAITLARDWTTRFETTSDAWMALATACRGAYRTRDALTAYEQALMLEERTDAALAAGFLYRQLGDHVTAGARFARAYAAGAGPEALRENARALAATGDVAAAAEAIRMWERETGRSWEG